MRTIVYFIFFLVIAGIVYFFVKIIKDGKKNLLKTMLKNNDINYETYLKYMEKM